MHPAWTACAQRRRNRGRVPYCSRMQTGDDPGVEGAVTRRRLPIPAVFVVILAFLFVPQTVVLFAMGAPAFEPENGVVRAEVASELLPDLGGAIIAALVIAWLGWWALVWREPRRTRPWVWVIPVVILVTAIAGIGYGHLAGVGFTLSATLLVGTLFTGFSEELLFRGIVLQAFRDRTTEGWSAAWSSILFGLTHLINVVVLGSGALWQAATAAGMGYVLYLCRRVSGSLLLPIVVHWLVDFSLDSHTIGMLAEPSELADGALALFLVEIAMIVVALAGVRAVNPRARETAAARS